MTASSFEYVRAASWEDAVAQLQRGGEEARVIAGGQSLAPLMIMRCARPGLLVDVAAAGERTITRVGDHIEISALVRHVELERSAELRHACPMLPEAAALVGNVRVRHRGTIGGTLAYGDPTAEYACAALVLGATIAALGPRGERTVAARDMFLAPFRTALEPGEVVTRIDVPAITPRQGTCLTELAPRVGVLALVEASALVTLDLEGRCEGVRVAVGAIGDCPEDVTPALAGLLGERPDERRVAALAREAAATVAVRPNPHASVGYRREISAVLITRAVVEASARAAQGDAA